MKIRIIILCGVLLCGTHMLHATEWYSYNYEFPFFHYKAEQLMGSQSKAPDMFPVAAKMNNYVKRKIEAGALKNKPVEYTLYGLNNMKERTLYLVEIYETQHAYHIEINYPHYFSMYFDENELVKIIEYFAHREFKPFYCDTSRSRIDLARAILFKNIDPLVGNSIPVKTETATYTVYEQDSLKIHLCNKQFQVMWGNKDLGITLEYPISIPIKFNNRIIFANNQYFYVIENGKNIKKAKTEGMLWRNNIQEESNKFNVQIYSDWLNICDFEGKPRYCYSYRKNEFYELKN